MNTQADNEFNRIMMMLDIVDKSIEAVLGGHMNDMNRSLVKEENKEDCCHGSKQTVFESNYEKYLSMLKGGQGHKFIVDNIADPHKLLGEIFEIVMANTECDAGMYLKDKVIKEIEKAAEPNVFEVKQAD